MHNYDYKVNLARDTAASNVIKMVGNEKRVLEIGAGPGSISKHLISNNCLVTAIEIDKAAIKLLAEHCKDIHEVDLNNPNWASNFKNDFDVVVAADVLEHLIHPLETLKNMKSLVKDGGHIIISLPHVGHSSVIASIVNNNFSYTKTGLLDQTHIRFFGLTNIQDLFDKAGLSIIEVKFVLRHPENTELSDNWIKIPYRLKSILLARPEGFIYQVVVKSSPLSNGLPSIDLSKVAIDSKKIIKAQRFIRFKKFLKKNLPHGVVSYLKNRSNK